MNSLAELNNYSNTVVPYNDDRPANVVFSSNVTSITLFPYENIPFLANPATEITSITSLPEPIKFSINLYNLPTSTITWGNLSGLGTGNLYFSSSANVYTIDNIRNTLDWQIIRAPTITLPVNPPDTWSYTSTLTYINGNVRSWTTIVNVTQLDQLSTPSDTYYAGDGDPPVQLNYTPNVIDLGIPAFQTNNYTLTIKPSNVSVMGNLTSSGIGATSNFNTTNKVLTITGNAQGVNNHLDNLYYWFTANLDADWTAAYSLYNPSSTFYSNVTQSINSLGNAFMSRPPAEYYDTNISEVMTNTPNISPTIFGAGATNTLRIQALPNIALSNISTTGTGGTSVYSANILTITGTVAQINSRLGNITIKSGVDYANDFTLQYQLTTSNNVTVTRLQSMLVSNATGVNNLNVNRYFVQNTANQTLFPNLVPQITETISGSDQYTLILTTSIGKFGLTEASLTQNYSYTGTKTQVNNIIPTIKFYPNKDVTGSQLFNIQIIRNGTITRVNQNVNLIGADRITPISGSGNYYVYDTLSTQTVNFTYEQANYLTANILLVGGGGGAAGTIQTGFYASPWPPTNLTQNGVITTTGYTGTRPQWVTGGGGGGGAVVSVNNVVIGSNASITVGSGGAGGIGLFSGTGSAGIPGQGTAGGTTSITFSGVTYSAAGGQGGMASTFNSAAGNPSSSPFSGGFIGGSAGNGNGGNNPPSAVTNQAPIAGQGTNPCYPFWSGGGGGAGGGATNDWYGSYGPGVTSATWAGTFGRGGSGRPGYSTNGAGEGGEAVNGGFMPTGVPGSYTSTYRLFTAELSGNGGQKGLVVIKFN